MSSFPDYDPRASEIFGHRVRLAELRQIRERVDYIASATPVFMSDAERACLHAKQSLSHAIACYERGIATVYKTGAPREEK